MMMQTAANTTTTTTNNTNALLTFGGCARLLVAARLPLLSSTPEEEEEQPQQLSFEALNAALRQRALLAAADRLFPALVAAAEACHGAMEEPPLECHTRKLLTACMIEAHPINFFEFPTEPLEAALSAATGPFLRTLGRLVVEASLLTPQEELERPLHMLLPLGLLGELRPQMAAFEAAHAAWTAVDLPRIVRRLSPALLGLAQARGTAVAAVDNALVAHIDTSVARLRAQLARLDGGAAALAAIDAVGDDVDGLLLLPDLNLVVAPDDDNNNADADDNNADA
jgi:hypothetical protein